MNRLLAALLALSFCAGAFAQRSASGPAPAPNEGVVLTVDRATREIVIRHGRLNEFDMPPMTMTFEVKEASLLDQAKAGDRVLFRVEILNGRFTVTEIQRRADGAMQIIQSREIPIGRAAPGASHALRLSVHVFRGGSWPEGEVEAAVLAAARFLEQCGVSLSRAELRVVEAPARFRLYSTPVSRELLRHMPVRKPAIFFVDDTLNDPAFDAEAIGRANAATRTELADTVWVVHGARDLPQVLAHELVHLLSDSGAHSEEPQNLMRAETSPRNTRLTDAQCELLRSKAQANGLLMTVRR